MKGSFLRCFKKNKSMKIAIISDTHENLSNMEKFCSFAKEKKIKNVIHCGDVHNKEKLGKLIKEFNGKIFYVLGNADIKEDILKFKNNPKIKIFEDFGEIKIDNLKIGFTHFPDSAKKMAQQKKYAFIFFGHTHKPWLGKKGNCILANPGNLAGLNYRTTFAILDTKKKSMELKILKNYLFKKLSKAPDAHA